MEKFDKSVDKGDENSPLGLRDEASRISEILLDAQECLKILEYLLLPDPDVDVYLSKRDYFWRFTTSVYAERVLLKLNILLTPKEDFSIARFLKKLGSEGKFAGVIPENKIVLWEGELGKLSATVKRISTRRNKEIAHKDRNHTKDKAEGISLTDLKRIIVLVQNILKDIYMITSYSSFLIDEPVGSPVLSLKKIMSVLNEDRRRFLAPLYEEGRKCNLHHELPPSERK
ncbi:AbiU2 domain-containing protein [Mucilaginibacter rubeus]|uniref:AbiU2 domain-containing protein n=1 Tax=Mucilaginibacter rubeus TaxID=2027860 RepID=UPI00166EECE9|nr:hypothetical protein [Mucilaginibacter rubeus]GGA95787.1 hypothetical protein GCM10011500_09460 [Mucilaginibacter rubeus]